MSGARMSSGLPVREAVALAAAWWQDIGRRLANPELRDPDLGIASGITRGLGWDHLTRGERVRVVRAWHDEFGARAAARAGLGVGRRGLAVPE